MLIVKPEAVGDAPQKVFEQKKNIFRSSQVIWYILGVVEILIGFRVVLKAFAANPNSGFSNLVYSLTNILIMPFRGIFGVGVSGGSVLEPSALVAVVVYLVLAWGLVYLLDLINPVTPEKVAAEGI